MKCKTCGGKGVLLGTLGGPKLMTVWYRCRQCGMEFYRLKRGKSPKNV